MEFNPEIGLSVWVYVYVYVYVYVCLNFIINMLLTFILLYVFYVDFKSCSSSGKKRMTAYIIGGVVGLCIILLILGFLQWKGCLRGRKREEKGMSYTDFKYCLVLIHCIFLQVSAIGMSTLYLSWLQISNFYLTKEPCIWPPLSETFFPLEYAMFSPLYFFPLPGFDTWLLFNLSAHPYKIACPSCTYPFKKNEDGCFFSIK